MWILRKQAPVTNWARSWHAIKYLDPAESGAVLPILHVNGFKISERTIFGCMDNREIVCLFTGYGYQVRIVEDLNDIDNDLHSSMLWAVEEIRKIQKAARSGKPIMKPRWPIIVLRTPKVSYLGGTMMILRLMCFRVGLGRKNCTASSSRGRSIPTRFLFPMPRRTTKNSRLCRSGCLRTSQRIFSRMMGTLLTKSNPSFPPMTGNLECDLRLTRVM